jgi:hypothetical protein
LLVPAQAQILTADSAYRIVTLKPDEHGFDIQLVSETDHTDAQNWVYFKIETKIYQEIIRSDGSRKVFELTPKKFFQIAKVGDIVRVEGGRDWDMSIAAYKIWLAPVKDGVIDPSLLKPD